MPHTVMMSLNKIIPKIIPARKKPVVPVVAIVHRKMKLRIIVTMSNRAPDPHGRGQLQNRNLFRNPNLYPDRIPAIPQTMGKLRVVRINGKSSPLTRKNRLFNENLLYPVKFS